MSVLKFQKQIPHHVKNTPQTIYTNLYDLIEAVMSSARKEEDHLTTFIVSHILDAGNMRMSKDLSENIRE